MSVHSFGDWTQAGIAIGQREVDNKVRVGATAAWLLRLPVSPRGPA